MLAVALLLACSVSEAPAPPAPAPEPVAPEIAAAEPKPEPARPGLPDKDPEVVAIFKGAGGFMPDAFMGAMNHITELGPERTLPTLLQMIDEEEAPRRLWTLCEAVQRLDVRDARVAPWVAPKLSHRDPLVVGACGSALAHSLPLGDPAVEAVKEVLDDASGECTARHNIANAQREPTLCEFFATKANGKGCGTKVGIAGLHICPDHTGLLVDIAGNEAQPLDTREGALHSLRSHPPQPDARPMYLRWVDPENPTNGMTTALSLLSDVALVDDKPRIQAVIDEDPHDGAGVHARAARATLAAMRSRGL